MSYERAVITDSNRSVDERITYLIERMTLDEKIAQLGSYWIYQLLENQAFSAEKARTLLANGGGQITRLGGASNLRPKQIAALANQIQKYLIEETRLGIPAIIHEECCSGYMTRGATVFPQAIGVASTWEPELVEQMADVIRQQMRAVGAHHALAPVLDIARDARWGRVEETFGEDPYLTATLGTAYIRGIQGASFADGVIATGKHFVGYSMSEGGMNWAPVHLTERELRETYLHPFEAAIREANLGSIMNAYHEIDGVPCGISKTLLTDILRDEWGFEGTVVSDYFTVNTLMEYHHIARSKGDAAVQALEAGIDVELPFTDCYSDPLREAVTAGVISEAVIDRSVRRVLAQKFAAGLFENPYVDADAVEFDTPDQRQLARKIAQQSLVLLKNQDSLLPLDTGLNSIAVIGPNADSVRNLFGDYAYPAHIETLIEAQRHGNMFNQPLPADILDAEGFIPAISVLEAIRAKLGSGAEIRYAKGCEVQDASTAGFAEAAEAARGAQVAIVVVGDKAGLTDECTSGEARDRAELDLPGVQGALVQAVYETGTPVVLVLVNGRPVSLGELAENVPAIIESWFPSEEGANAIADALFGDTNPGGKLPISFPQTAGQIPVFYGHRPSGGRSHWKEKYVETSNQPLYPFGYGLSYTQFEFSNLRIAQQTVEAGGEITVQVDVTNVGERAGDEVAQLYTHQQVRGITRPVKELKAFKRVTLAPQETRTVTLRVPVNLLGFYSIDNRYVVEPGTVEIMVGSSSQHIHCAGAVEITGERKAVEKAFFSTAE